MSSIKFRLVPEKLAIKPYDIEDPERVDIQRLYNRCYAMVYDGEKADYINKTVGGEEKIVAQAEKAGCSLEMFMLCNLLGFREFYQERHFYATMLMGSSSLKRVDMYSETCRKLYGVFDARSVLMLLKKEDKTKTLESSFYNSEVLAATYVIGCKIDGTKDIIDNFYREKEIALDPLWLAIEPTYSYILQAHVKNPSGTREQVRHRYRVTSALRELKRSKDKAIETFQLREKIAARSIDEVLQRYGLTVDDLEVNTKIVDMMGFWAKIGLAIQRYLIFQTINGDEHATRMLGDR